MASFDFLSEWITVAGTAEAWAAMAATGHSAPAVFATFLKWHTLPWITWLLLVWMDFVAPTCKAQPFSKWQLKDSLMADKIGWCQDWFHMAHKFHVVFCQCFKGVKTKPKSCFFGFVLWRVPGVWTVNHQPEAVNHQQGFFQARSTYENLT